MKILNISSNDYSNASHHNANALRHIGIDCVDYCLAQHPFNYKSQSEVITRDGIKAIYRNYDVIQIFHTDEPLLLLVGSHPRIVVYHTGTRYRNEPEKYNKIFNPFVQTTITDHCEFMGLGAKNIHYLAPHIELTPTIKADTSKLIVGHYPSNAEVKGTETIRKVIEPLKGFFDVRIHEEKLNHEANLKRVAECHIYIELFKPELNGKQYGHFGVSAFEAAALGCKVITQNYHQKHYTDVYGECPFVIVDTEHDLYNAIYNMRNWSSQSLLTKYEFYRNHNITATGNRILKLING